MRRLLIIVGSLIALVALAACIAGWVLLAAWVPDKGKALLITELERRWPIEVAIASVRYDPLRGWLVEDVEVTDYSGRQLHAALPLLQVRVNWLALLGRQAAFRGHAQLRQPLATDVAFAGRYHLKQRWLTLEVTSTDVALRALPEALARYLPPQLTDGTIRAHLTLRQAANAAPSLSGWIEADGLAWDTTLPSGRPGMNPAPRPWGGLKLLGDVALEGTADPPAGANGRWAFRAEASLAQGRIEGVPIVGALEQVKGRARLTPERLEIDALSGVALGVPWDAQGHVAFGAPPSIEALVRSEVRLAPLAAATPTIAPQWQPAGVAAVLTVCRGPLTSPPLLDCLMDAQLRGASLAGAALAHPITDVSGRVGFELLTRRLTLEGLKGRLAGNPLSASGMLTLGRPMQFTLHLVGTAPLASLGPWLPAEPQVSELAGTVGFDGDLVGSSAAPQVMGTVALEQASARLPMRGILVEAVTGVAHATAGRIDISTATLRLNGEPLSLSATLSPRTARGDVGWLLTPRFDATVAFDRGRLRLAGEIEPQVIRIEQSRLTLEDTDVRVRGALARTPHGQSRLSLDGEMDVTELPDAPFLSLPALETWRLEGLVQVSGEFQGRLADWRAALIRGRVQSDALSVREVPLTQLTCAVEQTQRQLRVLPSALVADGRLQADLVVQHGPKESRYRLTADLTGMQLATLARAIPSWRNRGISGDASAHAQLQGQWNARETWTGEGWVNATGQQLASLPLLEKVFRGLFGVLADRLGLDELRRAQITQASVRWQLARQRFATEDLRLTGSAGAEPIGVYAKGSVGMDGALDLVIEPELSEQLVLQAPKVSSVAGTVLRAAGALDRLRRYVGRHRLTGTLKEPSYTFEYSLEEFFKNLLAGPSPGEVLQHLIDAIR